MSKELEALNYLKQDYYYNNLPAYKQAYDTIKQALTPPTEQEVCKALSEYLGEKVYYEERPNRVFSLGLPVDTFNFIVEQQDYNTIVFNRDILEYIQPHILEIIGRFYESEAQDV